MTYQYNKTCKCGNTNSIEVSKRESAFELKDSFVYGLECEKCGNKGFSSISSNKPKIDEELLKEWAENTDLYFSSQDEDLLLAQEYDNIDLYLKFIDKESIDIGKRNTLIEALCVMIYDNADENEKEKMEIVKKVSSELKKRIEIVKQADSWIMDYIKEVSFPIIGIEFKEKPNKSELNTTTENKGWWNKIKQIWN
jgi:hypothetical protein